ncbi:hypothetical protein BC936DRAFT_147098 [Jimgerdemannia flammicorona]|uniref:Uncharacterized protein n=1 Tax=Jimgerdemannia flammicorona TaxID=994334 RepID=A0A433D673_9FUNG|nr:hypothetical protein BC936DRAFT_147098 [Jimgerdemannia flammicorona]
MGIDDAILQELQRSWENKVAQSRVANFAVSEDSYYAEDADIEAAPGGAGSASQFHAVSPAETFSQAAAAASLATLASAGAAMQNAEAQNAVGKPQQFMVHVHE